MVNGEVIASDVPERHPQPPATCSVAYLGDDALSSAMSARSWRLERPARAYYGDSHVLRGVDLRDPGAARSLGLLGRNGMGKTTLIRTLMGYVRAAGGPGAAGRAAT